MSASAARRGADWEFTKNTRLRLLSGRGSVHSGALTTDGWASRYCDSRWSRPGEWEETGDPLSCRKCLHTDARLALQGIDPLDDGRDEA